MCLGNTDTVVGVMASQAEDGSAMYIDTATGNYLTPLEAGVFYQPQTTLRTDQPAPIFTVTDAEFNDGQDSAVRISSSLQNPWMFVIMMSIATIGMCLSYLRNNKKLKVMTVMLLGVPGSGKSFIAELPLYVLNFHPGGILSDTGVQYIRNKMCSTYNLVWSWQDAMNTSNVQRRGIGSIMKNVIKHAFDGTDGRTVNNRGILSYSQNVMTLNHRPVPDP